jgi:Notch-like protein
MVLFPAEDMCVPRPPVDAYQCMCLIGFTGLHCEIDVNECASAPCQNSASCTESGTDVAVVPGGYRCTCVAGYANGFCPDNPIAEYEVSCGVEHSLNDERCFDTPDDDGILAD